MESKDKSSRSASKTELNESTLPLLEADDAEHEGKEKLELKERSSGGGSEADEKDDSKTEKMDGDGDEKEGAGGEQPDDKKAKKKKKDEEKKKERSHRRSPSCVQTMTVGLNLLDRDEKRVNEHVNIQFEDILAETDGVHSFDGVWRTSYVTFIGARIWFYRILAAVCALPCAVCWGLNFALLSICHVWAITPLIRVLDLLFFFVKRIWSSIVHVVLDPIFESLGMMFVNVRIHQRREELLA